MARGDRWTCKITMQTRYLIPLIAAALVGCQSLQRGPVEDLPEVPAQSLFDKVRFASNGSDNMTIESVASDVNQATLNAIGDLKTATKDREGPSWDWADFSGVSIVENNRWQDKKTATLISPDFVIMAKHFRRSVGDTIKWKTQDGAIVARTLGSVRLCPFADLALGRLDKPVTGLAIYQVLPPGYNWETALRWSLSIHTDQEGKALIKRIHQATSSIVYLTPPPGFEALHENLVSGDSGNPFFAYYGSQLVLLGVHWTTSSANFISDTGVVAWIQETAPTM